MSQTTPTIDRLTDKIWIELIDGDHHPDTVTDEMIQGEVDSEVTPMTTNLFQMVVDDNALAFLQVDSDADITPFDSLRNAIVQTLVEQLIERRAHEARFYGEHVAEMRLKSFDHEAWSNL